MLLEWRDHLDDPKLDGQYAVNGCVDNEDKLRWKLRKEWLLCKRGPFSDHRISVQTSKVSEDRRVRATSRTRHTALGYILGAIVPIWELLQPLRLISPRRRRVKTQVQLSALLACSSFTAEFSASARFLSQHLNTAWIYHEPASICNAVVSVMCRTVSVPSGSNPAFMQPVHLSPSSSADEERRLAFRLPVIFERFHVSFSRSWLLRLVPVEEASTWMSNLNRADTTSALGTVCCFQTLTMNAECMAPFSLDTRVL